jgi:putative hemolysin
LSIATAVGLLIPLVFVGALLSALDRALTALGDAQLMDIKDGDGVSAPTAARILEDRDGMRIRLQTGRIMLLMASAALAWVLGDALAPGATWGLWGALAVTGLIYGMLAVAMSIAVRARATAWALPVLRICKPVELALWPFALPLIVVARLVDRLLPREKDDAAKQVVREVEHLIERQEESGTIPEEFAELVLSVLEFKDTVAREVMVPRTQMTAFALDTPLQDILQQIVKDGHSRYPVYKDRVDQVEGILYAKDLFRILKDDPEARDNFTLAKLIRRPPFFVAETHPIGKLLREMQARRVHLAVVVDEFGGTSGILTLEDIVEEIVGEIRDEHDREQPLVREISPGRWWADARITIYDLNDVLEADLDEDEVYDSLGGMVLELAGRVPEVGQSIAHAGFEFIVREADERHVTRVEVLRESSQAA